MRRYRCVFCRAVASTRLDSCPNCKDDGLVAERVASDHAPERASSLSKEDEARVDAPLELRELFPRGIPIPCVIVVTGPPGVGKTTIATRWSTSFGGEGLIASTEQTKAAVVEAAKRAGADLDRLFVAEVALVEDLERAASRRRFISVVVDSIDELMEDEDDLSPRERPIRLMRRLVTLARTSNAIVWAIGQTTKTDDLAGPRRAEHLADATLHVSDTMIRAAKNRFGPKLEVPREAGAGPSRKVNRHPAGGLRAPREAP